VGSIGGWTSKIVKAMRLIFYTIFSSILLASSVASLGQEIATQQDSLTARTLDEVVITGQFEPQSLSKSVHRIHTISSQLIRAKGATRLQDVLNTELNIRFSQDLALGSSTISMMGLSGQNVKVLLDGIPVVGRQGTSNAVDINQIDVNNIDRIEIIEGPMAVIYGADALAGVINIITKKPKEGKYSITARVQEETVGSEYGRKQGIHNQYISADYRYKKMYTSANFGRNAFGGWVGDATGREKQWHPKTQWLGAGVVGLQNDWFNVYYRVDYMDETITNPGEFNGNEAIDKDFISTRFTHQLQGIGKVNERLSFNTAFAYTDFSRETQTTTVNKTTGDVRLAVGADFQDITRFDGFTLRGTVQYKINNWLALQPGVDINTESGSGDRLKAGTNKISDYAGFISSDIKIGKKISVRPGVRLLRNSVYNAPSGVASANIKLDVHKNQDVRIAYGRGFRAPSLRELYFDFFDASHSIEGNPNLEAELSHSLTGSWNWRIHTTEKSQTTTTLAGFYNTIDNLITTGVLPGSTNTTYINIANSKTQGGTFSAVLKYGHTELSAGYGYTGRLNQLTQQDQTLPDFTWTGEVTANLSHNFSNAGLTATINYKYTGKTPFYEVVIDDTVQRIRLAENDGFHWADVSLQKNLFKSWTVTLGVRNAFNVERINSTSEANGAHTASGSRPIGYGRSYYTAINFNLFK
jgi:outer membrane receptor for ferrienterochelin and colicins